MNSKRYNFQEGAMLLVNKPLTWTSFDVVNKIRYALRQSLNVKKIKVGHAGTLDPLATGLLIICTGKFTKTLDSIQAQVKEYTGTITLGAITPSYDAETEVSQTFPTEHLTPTQLEEVRDSFIGAQEQFPPVYSAIKVDGKPLYKRARQGEYIEVKARPVTINSFDLTRVDIPEVDFKVSCSKGTYIRSIAFDFGKKLDNGGYLTALCRTKIGEYKIEDAWDLTELITYIQENYGPEDNIKLQQK
jgi:tRNA pseudouridine55 synthase